MIIDDLQKEHLKRNAGVHRVKTKEIFTGFVPRTENFHILLGSANANLVRLYAYHLGLPMVFLLKYQAISYDIKSQKPEY